MKAILTICLLISSLWIFAQDNNKFIPNGNNTQRLLKSTAQTGLKTEGDKQFFFAALYHAGQTSNAMTYYEKDLDKTKLTKPIKIIYARCLMSNYKYKEAFLLIKQMIVNEKNTDVELELLMAQCLIAIKEFKHPKKILNDIISVEANHATAHYYLSLIMVAEGKLPEAIKHAQVTIMNSERNTLLARKATTVILSSRFKMQNDKKDEILKDFEKNKKDKEK